METATKNTLSPRRLLRLGKIILASACLATWGVGLALAQTNVFNSGELDIKQTKNYFGEKPVPVSLEGFSGETEQVLKFDLYVQGCSFVAPGAGQYTIKGSSAGNVTGTLTDNLSKQVKFSKIYNGASERLQAHAFADDVIAVIRNFKPNCAIGRTKIAYKSQSPSGNGEIYLADFDGSSPQEVTSDHTIVAKPAWVPGRMALYYTSYAHSNPDIFYHSLSSGQRRVIAGYSGLNTSAAVSPDGSKVAMILSKMGSPNVWVCNADGSDLRRLTKGIEDSSPCWSPDGQWICFASKMNGRRALAKVRSSGGEVQRFPTTGAPNPTEPDWSPDGKWIAFTSQAGDFNIYVISADASKGPAPIVSGQNPSWAPNSRTLVYNHGPDGRQSVAVVDVFTKQTRDCRHAPGSNSQPAWAR